MYIPAASTAMKLLDAKPGYSTQYVIDCIFFNGMFLVCHGNQIFEQPFCIS